jgi:gamma-glutamylcyclotransferase (GGCT)/AIG2-like uncharacterized protein YtfP
MTLVFVYGTLMKNQYNNHYLKNEKFIGRGETVNKFSMTVSNTVPFLNRDEKYTIHGELYRISNETLKNLDKIESNGEWYVRRPVQITVDNEIYEAQAYFNDDKGEIDIPSGDYRNYIEELIKLYECTT